jgi:hypothetical protein
MRLRWVLVFAHEGVGIIRLIEIAESVVDLAVLTLVCTDYYMSAWDL